MRSDDYQAYLAAVREDFKVFLIQAFTTLYPQKAFMDNWHIDAIVHHLELTIEGRVNRLMINLPPRHLKSFIVSVAFPAFILGIDPTAKIICVSYSDELAVALSRDFRRIVTSEWYKQAFGNVQLVKTTENEIVTAEGGFRYATSVGGTLTGRGGDFIIVDDPLKPEDALSDRKRLATNEWYKNTLLSRLDDKRRSALIIVMQRLHVQDLCGYLEDGREFIKLSFPAIATHVENIPTGHNEYYRREEGEPLQEERESLRDLCRLRDQIGPHNFAAQYQQQPESPEGTLIKRRWLNVVDQLPRKSRDGYLIVSIDTALSTSETADFTALTLMYCDETGYYVLNVERGHWDYEDLKNKVEAYQERYGDDLYFIVEAAGAGISLIQYLGKSGAHCFHYFPKDDKIVRTSLVLPIFQQGRVFIVARQGRDAWVNPLINELVSFPHGRNDDQVDCIVQAIRWGEPRINRGAQFYWV